MSRTVAVVIGVPDPQPFTFQGTRCPFPPAPGVLNDVAWFQAMLTYVVPEADLTLEVLSTAEQTEALNLENRLKANAKALRHGDLMLLVLAGHGFQVPDLNGDETDDLYDEVFAAHDTGIADDFFAGVWTAVPATANIVVIADTCSSDSITDEEVDITDRGVGRDITSILTIKAPAPRRLSIAAAMPWEEALERPTNRGPRGVMSQALQDAWSQPESRTSYRNWFTEAAKSASLRSPQHPRLRSLGPDDALLNSPPLA